jgi:hypothetical protein
MGTAWYVWISLYSVHISKSKYLNTVNLREAGERHHNKTATIPLILQ